MVNKLGKKIIIPLPKGLFFCIVWVDSKLSNLKIVVSDDGLSIKMRSKVPKPDTVAELLSHCTWAADEENVVTQHVDEEITRLKDSLKSNGDDEWTDAEIFSLDQEVIRTFTDRKGQPTGGIGFNSDKDGRQIIAFFVKTSEAHQSRPMAGTFKNTNNSSSSNNNNNNNTNNNHDATGMDVGGDEVSTESFEETVDDIRAHMDERFTTIGQQQHEMANQLSNMMNMMNNINGFMMQAKREHEQQQAVQQQQFYSPTNGATPDNTFSS